MTEVTSWVPLTIADLQHDFESCSDAAHLKIPQLAGLIEMGSKVSTCTSDLTSAVFEVEQQKRRLCSMLAQNRAILEPIALKRIVQCSRQCLDDAGGFSREAPGSSDSMQQYADLVAKSPVIVRPVQVPFAFAQVVDKQNRKDIGRDEVVLNGTVFRGAEAGYDAIVSQ
mmetsp:Transcript_89723/g.240702  ORF Transcript_89723/g.240702 Transcript_89723/m.240702 type:complete len:169 (+) Transcript_89723:3-509(+)